MKNGKYTLEDIDDRIIRYFDAHIKQTLKYTKIDFIKQHSKNREYDDLLKEKKFRDEAEDKPDYDRYTFAEIKVGDYVIEFESEDLFNQIMSLTDKQREVLLKSVVLDTPMKIIANEMGIGENKVYKHKKNALSTLAKRMKADEL